MVIHVLVCIVYGVCIGSDKGPKTVPCSGVATGSAAAGSGSSDTVTRPAASNVAHVGGVIVSAITIIMTSIPGTGVLI